MNKENPHHWSNIEDAEEMRRKNRAQRYGRIYNALVAWAMRDLTLSLSDAEYLAEKILHYEGGAIK